MPKNEQPRRNGQILRKVQLSKTEQEDTENMNRSIRNTGIETVI